MPDIPSDVWLSIGSAIGAALLLFVTRAVVDWMKDRRALEREREARAARRNDEDRIRHLSSQLEILTELQKAVDEFGRTAAMMSNANRRAYKDTGEWKKNVYGHELDQRAHQSERRTLLLGAQVDNAEVPAVKGNAALVVGGSTCGNSGRERERLRSGSTRGRLAERASRSHLTPAPYRCPNLESYAFAQFNEAGEPRDPSGDSGTPWSRRCPMTRWTPPRNKFREPAGKSIDWPA